MMSFRLRESDYKIIECIAEYNILTVPQITAIFQKNKQVLRRRFRELKRQGLVNMTNREFGRTRGRPESLLGLTEHGLDILKEEGIIDRDVPYENVSPVSIRRVDHQILLNRFRVHLNQIKRVLPRLSVRFLAYNSPFLPRQPDGRTIISDSSPIGRRSVREVRFTPDAVFATTDAVQGKTLLFFLEVDCGTETLSSPQCKMTDIRQKILNYQWYFQSLRYKRYKEIFNTSRLHGFRLLFVTKTIGRLAALCKLIQEMEPSSFIWLTEYSRLSPEGVSAKIWAVGGDLNGPQDSIFGRLCCNAPLP